MKNIQRAWAVSLIVIGLSAAVIAASGLLPGAAPERAVRLAGAADLLALPVLAFTTVRKMQLKS